MLDGPAQPSIDNAPRKRCIHQRQLPSALTAYNQPGTRFLLRTPADLRHPHACRLADASGAACFSAGVEGGFRHATYSHRYVHKYVHGHVFCTISQRLLAYCTPGCALSHDSTRSTNRSTSMAAHGSHGCTEICPRLRYAHAHGCKCVTYIDTHVYSLVCAHVCAHVDAGVCTRVHLPVQMFMHMPTHTCLTARACTHVSTHVCVLVRAHVFTHLCTCSCVRKEG